MAGIRLEAMLSYSHAVDNMAHLWVGDGCSAVPRTRNLHQMCRILRQANSSELVAWHKLEQKGHSGGTEMRQRHHHGSVGNSEQSRI